MIREIGKRSESGLVSLTVIFHRSLITALMFEEFRIKVVDVSLKPRALSRIEAVHHIGLHQSERFVAWTASVMVD